MKIWVLIFLGLLGISGSAEEKSLSQLQLDSVEFSNADLSSVLSFLGDKAKQMKGKPANFMLYDPSGELAKADKKITLSLKNVPFSEVIKYVTKLSQTEFLIDRRVVWIGYPAALQKLRSRRASRNSNIMTSPAFQRMAGISGPNIEFSNTPFVEVVESLRQLDRAASGPGNFVIIESDTLTAADAKLSMKVSGLSLTELVQYSAELSGFRLRADRNAIIFRAPDSRVQPVLPPGRITTYLGERELDKISLVEVPVPDMAQFIGHHSKSSAAPKGINVVLFTSTAKTVTLDLIKPRLLDILRYMNEQTDTTFQVDKTTMKIIDLPPPKEN
ncbi:MAG: hypothetical protein P1V20_09985 [Verrucomicrobiales bacterium]|nr:hypothetical protein [Verrucomicrobiales bacterium]